MRALALLGAGLLAAAPAQAARWTVDPAASRIGYTASWVGKPVQGGFKTWAATIDFDPAAPDKAAITVVVDLRSSATGDRTVDGALPGVDWFDTGKTPQARFVARRVTRAEPDRWLANGTLTMRGVTAPVALPFSLSIAGDTATMQGTARLDRRAWKLGLGSDAPGEWVAFPVTVNVRVVARRAR